MANNSNPNATSVQVFNNEQFGEVRVAVNENGEPTFCLSDLCKVLELALNGVSQRLDKGVISTYPLETNGGVQNALFVNEDGMYDVVLDSRKPEAKAFRKWITSEVLPTIRKTGGYMLARKDVTFSATIKFIESMCKNVRMSDDAKLSMYRDVAELYGISAEILPSYATAIGIFAQYACC